MSACSTSSKSSGSPTANKLGGDWFCQTGVHPDDWECVQDSELAAQPKPTRSPPARSTPTPAARVYAPEVSPAEVPTVSKTQAAAPVAAQIMKPPIDTTSGPTDAPADADRQLPSGLPDYIRLAFRPAKAVSMLEVPAEYWAVQLVALSSKEALEDFVRDADIKGMSAARIAVDGDKLFYILLLGIYETLETAQDVSRDLPPPFENPWIRSVGSVQAGMLLAEELTGSSEL